MKRALASPRRLRRTAARRRAPLLAAFARSGLWAAAFARQYKLNYTTFCGWRHQRAKARPGFVQVEVAPAPVAPAELVLELGTQARVRIGSASQVALAARLLQTLQACAPC